MSLFHGPVMTAPSHAPLHPYNSQITILAIRLRLGVRDAIKSDSAHIPSVRLEQKPPSMVARGTIALVDSSHELLEIAKTLRSA